MKKERKPESFIKKAEYPGGGKALKGFIQKELRYPKEAAEKKIEGTVRLRLDIDKNGKVTKAQVIHGLGHGCDEEAQRIAKKLKFITDPPKKGRVIYHKEINIPFKLPKKPGMQYQYKPKQQKPEENQPPGKRTYTYTINVNNQN